MTQTNVAGAEADLDATEQSSHANKNLPILVLGAIGVVYGDIGTSPIYAFRQALADGASQATLASDVLGLLSLIVWALIITVTIKYVIFVTRADNRGEGGILSLMSLAKTGFTGKTTWIIALGVLGAALFFGDSIITPAISVLSAVEGVETIAPSLSVWVLPATVVILLALFMFQRFGTATVASVFGPVMVVWFLVIGLSGLVHIVATPQVLLAINPYYGLHFLATHWGIAGVVIGAVFLAVTGGEALYADLGHFGRRPVAVAWLSLVFPCLLLNYFGQGAFVLQGGISAAANPFFEMHPEWARIPVVVLSTAATVIASQAVISGAYSLAQQAIALNLLPRMTVRHTSETALGQIYMPQVNSMLLVSVLLLVVGFKSSAALSSAYGISVSGVMLVTSVFLAIVMWRIWKWPKPAIFAVMIPLFIVDLGFVVANMGKILDGGWVPAGVAAWIALIMIVWMVGRQRLIEKTRRDEVPLEFLVQNLTKKRPIIVPGTAVFLTSDATGAPTALLHSLKHYKVLHEKNVILTVQTSNLPRVPDNEKVRIESMSELFYRVIVTFGYVETPNIPKALGLARKLGWKFDIMSTSFFLSRRSIKPSPKGGMPFWADRLFIALARNATDATEYFHIPTGRVVEIGTQVTI
ncbi:MAG TPA: potassium transporter Kup [Devosiaceae bacterium]|nr:potassium transporter Kup [Devosiaceae bacterium]